MKRSSLLLCAGVALYAAGTAVDYAAEGKLWWAHIQYLADDKLAGRDTGSEGYQQAVTYATAQFERAGLKPMGTSGYQQPVQFDKKELVPAESSLALVRDGQVEPLAMGVEASLSARGDLAAEVEAPMVFVGYGLQIPEAKYDDLAGQDLKGKIAVYVNAGGPVKAPANLKSHYSSGAERWAALRRAGAIGIATIPGGRGPNGAGGQTPPAGRGNAAGGRGGRGLTPQPTVALAEKALQETQGEQVVMTVTRAGAEKLFAGSGHTFDEIEKLANASEPLPAFPLKGTLRSKAVVKHSGLAASNVVGVLPGTDRKLKNEYVIMSAHLDHLGTGRAVNGDSIYNGAMDDASGVASVMEIARLMKATGVKPKRSIVFLLVTAEEKGELGSRYFAAHPTVPAGQIVADINLDMFLPLYALKVIEVQGLAESSLGETVRAARRVVRSRGAGGSGAGAESLHSQRSVQLYPPRRAVAGIQIRIRARLAGGKDPARLGEEHLPQAGGRFEPARGRRRRGTVRPHHFKPAGACGGRAGSPALEQRQLLQTVRREAGVGWRHATESRGDGCVCRFSGCRESARAAPPGGNHRPAGFHRRHHPGG